MNIELYINDEKGMNQGYPALGFVITVHITLLETSCRGKVLQAKPNADRYALTELSKNNTKFIILTQNVDGMYGVIVSNKGGDVI